MPPDVAAVFASFPEAASERLMQIRALVFREAAARAVGPVIETLKWGEPAYLTQKPKTGATIRLGWKPRRPETCLLLVNCRTTLIEEYRGILPEGFSFQGKRAVEIPAGGALPEEALRLCIGRALTYHSRKRP